MTDSIKQIKIDAREAFEKGNYALSFQTLWKAGVVEFISYGEKRIKDPKKENWFTHSASAPFFWNSFVLQEHVFREIFLSKFADQLLYNYFTFYKIQCIEFESKLAKDFPLVFVKAVRTNQVFLKSDRIDTICSLQIDKKFHIHQKVWKILFEKEQFFWKEVSDAVNDLKNHSLADILSYCIFWLETKRFPDDTQDSLHHLAHVYSLFIELLLEKYPEKVKNFSYTDDFYKQFSDSCKYIFDDPNLIDTSLVSKLFDKIDSWTSFMDAIVAPYCYDLNIEPIQQNELLYFNSTPQAHYEWKLNGFRYELNRLNYLNEASNYPQYLEDTGKTKIPGRTVVEIKENIDLAKSKWTTMCILKDLACTSFKLGKSKIDAEKLLTPLLSYSFNRKIWYEEKLDLYKALSGNLVETYSKMFIEALRSDLLNESYFLMSKFDYLQLNQSALEGVQEDVTKEFIQFFSYKSNPKEKFNRFRLRYDVWQNPFVTIGENLFCPVMFFANNGWFYSFVNKTLTFHKQADRTETIKMEHQFSEALKEKGWRVKLLNEQESKDLQGDVDIFVEDNDTLLFIQLKRTYFRLDLKSAYYESINSDAKAANQLNAAEKYLLQDNGIYQVVKKPVKWIVSTSFENIGAKIKGCSKINYFDILFALKNPEVQTVKELISALETDKYLKKIISSFNSDDLQVEEYSIFSEILQPLKINEPKNYRQAIFTDDENASEEYRLLFQKALEHDGNGEKEVALNILEACISKDSTDWDAYGQLANIYADLRMFDKSLVAYQKALELIPDDPFITRNYILALFESGKFYQGLVLAFRLYEKFPLLGDLKSIFESAFGKCLIEGLLSNDQVIEIQNKWDSMN